MPASLSCDVPRQWAYLANDAASAAFRFKPIRAHIDFKQATSRLPGVYFGSVVQGSEHHSIHCNQRLPVGAVNPHHSLQNGLVVGKQLEVLMRYRPRDLCNHC